MQTTNWQDRVINKFSRSLKEPYNINIDKNYLLISGPLGSLEINFNNNKFEIILMRKYNSKQELKFLEEYNDLELTTTIAQGWESNDEWKSK
jgi:hypothetical protein